MPLTGGNKSQQQQQQHITVTQPSAKVGDPCDGGTIVEVHEKHGPLHNAIPCMPIGVAIAFCIFNIIVPGLGTFFSAWTCLCGCRTKLSKPAKAFALNLASALLQMVTFVLIIGWVWSIIWGMNFIQISSESRRQRKGAAEQQGRAPTAATPSAPPAAADSQPQQMA